MTIWWLALIIVAIVAAASAFIWLVLFLGKLKGGGKSGLANYGDAAERDIEHIFNADFREELRNRGRLHFEKIINENADFLQQDLRITTSQINEYMKNEMTKKLQEEFSTYEQAINDARNLALDSIKKTNIALEEQRKVLGDQLTGEIAKEKARIIESFERRLAEVVNHYIIDAIGDQIALDDQLEYILADLELNKQAIIEDLRNAA